MDEWQEAVAEYCKKLSQSFRLLGIEKTKDEVRLIVEEELVRAQRQVIFDTFYRRFNPRGD